MRERARTSSQLARALSFTVADWKQRTTITFHVIHTDTHTDIAQNAVIAIYIIFINVSDNMRKFLYSGAVLAAVLAGANADADMPIVQNAMEMLARASSTSEVLTLNLTNLLILLVLKALIFGFGLFSVGGAGRSMEGPVVTEADLTGGMCFMMFASGASEKLSCIQRTACEDPYLANDYLTAAKMVYKAHKLLG